MKRSELLFSAVLVPLDYLMIALAAAAAYGLRFMPSVTNAFPVEFGTSLWQFLQIIVVLAPIVLAVLAVTGFYRIGRHESVADDLAKSFIGATVAVSAVAFYIVFSRELYESRFLLVATWAMVILAIPLGRFLLRRARLVMYRQGKGLHRVVLVGNGRTSARLRQSYEKRGSGHAVVADFETIEEGALKKLKKLGKDPGIDEVVVTSTRLPQKSLEALHELSEDHKWEFSIVPDIFGTRTPNFDVHEVAGIPLFELRPTRLAGWWRIIKRLIDIVGSFVLLVVLSPLFLVLAIVVKVDSRGPVFYGSERVNKTGTFRLWKFRSMVKNAEQQKKALMKKNERKGPLFKIDDDPRVTRVGTFTRATRLDELPQLWNVFKGEMSLVGPRPHLTSEVDHYEQHHKRVLQINSGMTGLAQVSGSSDLDFEEEVRLDTYYMENWSLTMDLSILFRTVRVVLMRRFGS